MKNFLTIIKKNYILNRNIHTSKMKKQLVAYMVAYVCNPVTQAKG